MINLFNYLKKLFELTDGRPTTNLETFYQLEQAGQTADSKDVLIENNHDPSTSPT